MAIKAFKKYVPGFENAYLTKVGMELRLREGRRIMGDHVLSRDDVATGRRFYDCIGKNSFAAGAVHVATNETIAASKDGVVAPPDGGTYDMPYRMLVPRKIENLLIAGKHVSAERAAYQRFLQETMVTGQAAGAAAALLSLIHISESKKPTFTFTTSFFHVWARTQFHSRRAARKPQGI